MVPSYQQMGDWLEEIAQQFPDAFFEDLDGGIQLEETALPDPDFPPGEMYIMGEYVHDSLGRYILLYYGSFAALLEEGIAGLAQAKEAHDRLERLYNPYVDFDGVSQTADQLARQVLALPRE